MATGFSIGAGKTSGTTDGVITGQIQLDVLPLGSKGRSEEILDNSTDDLTACCQQVATTRGAMNESPFAPSLARLSRATILKRLTSPAGDVYKLCYLQSGGMQICIRYFI